MRRIDEIVIHATATKEGRDHDMADVRRWHRQLGWDREGYHYLIQLDGEIEEGRPLEMVGAHVGGHNENSIGIVYVGGLDSDLNPKDTRTKAQKKAMRKLVGELKARFPNARVMGHRDFPGVNKACPCFDVEEWWNSTDRELDNPKDETSENRKDKPIIVTEYTVKPGDTIWGIAKKHGVPMGEIYQPRMININDPLDVGEVLTIIKEQD